jgi:deoxyhypusine synthase
MSSITSFIKHHYRHFNAAALIDAAEAYNKHLASGGKMFVTIGGAMSTAELGLSLAEMIRQDKIHGISCTGANLEEDVFNLVAHDFYERVPPASAQFKAWVMAKLPERPWGLGVDSKGNIYTSLLSG